MNLKTTYLGIPLPNPFMLALVHWETTRSVKKLKTPVLGGPGTASLYEEEIIGEQTLL
jgi:hypothetical protein